MREILFRAKNKYTGNWTEGDLIRQKDIFGNRNTCICQVLVDNLLQKIFVDPETVCQYTGLTDRNGRKIFEGDILSAHLDSSHPEDITYTQITWNGFSWCMRESAEEDVMTEWDCNIFEVCGNIFDNPELLEV